MAQVREFENFFVDFLHEYFFKRFERQCMILLLSFFREYSLHIFFLFPKIARQSYHDDKSYVNTEIKIVVTFLLQVPAPLEIPVTKKLSREVKVSNNHFIL